MRLVSNREGTWRISLLATRKRRTSRNRRLTFMSTDNIPTGNEDWSYRETIISIESGDDAGSQDD